MATDPTLGHKQDDNGDPTSSDPKAGGFEGQGIHKDDGDPTSSDPKAGGFESTGKPA